MKRLSIGQIAILSTLLNQDLSALEIVGTVRDTIGIEISSSGIYTTLHRLEKCKLISGYYRSEDIEQRRGHPKRYYHLSRLGNKKLDEASMLAGRVRDALT